MRLALGSDIHLEFGPLDIRNTMKADVLILAGDIVTVESWRKQKTKYASFYDQASQEFPRILQVMGNHEHYGGNILYTEKNLRDLLSKWSNVHLLEQECMFIDKYHFFGMTMWFDLGGAVMNANAAHALRFGMNDFSVIKKQEKAPYERFTPEDARALHNMSMSRLNETLNPEDNFVVISHHAPSWRSVHPKYRNSADYLMNYGYVSRLDTFIEEHKNIRLWMHGHTHIPHDYVIGETRVVCNPRGYIRYEPSALNFELQTIDLP